MQRDFAPTQYRGNQRDVIGGQGWILGHVGHPHGVVIPIDLEAEEVTRMFLNLLGGPEKQRIVNVESFSGEGDEAKKANCRQQYEGGRRDDDGFAFGWLYWFTHRA